MFTTTHTSPDEGALRIEDDAADAVLLAYATSGVTLAAADVLAVSPGVVEAGLRSGRSLRELAHELRVDPEDLQFGIAVIVSEGRDDERSDAMYIGAGELLDRRAGVPS
jgi:hypothetical protein